MNDTFRDVIGTGRRGCYAAIEALEGRVLLTASAIEPPVVSAFQCDVPAAVPAAEVKNGKSLTLSAQTFDNQSSKFRFYSDTNDNGVLDKGDKFLGTGKPDSGFYSLMVAPPDRQPGDTTCRFFVQAKGVGGVSAAMPLEVEVSAVTIGAFTCDKAVTQNKPIKLSAAAVKNAAAVEFFKDTNRNGVVDEGDVLLGAGTRAGKAWKLTVTAPLPAGPTRLMARAADVNGAFSTIWVLNLVVQP